MRTLGEIDETAWLAVADADPSATFFHTPMWSSVAEATGAWRAAATGFDLGDGHRAVYPAVVERRASWASLGRRSSTWAGCYGGPVATRALTERELGEIHGRVMRRSAGPVSVTLGPLTPQGGLPAGALHTADTTHTVEVDADFDTLLMRFSKGQRRAYKRGLRDGVVIRREDPAAMVGTYVELNDETLARRGSATTSRYAPEVFERLAELDGAELWSASHDGRLIAGMWVLRFNAHTVMWQIASRELDPPPPPAWMVSLLGEVVRDAAERGLRWVDFNPSGGHTGADDFKRHFGARELPVVRARFYSLRSKIAGRVAARVGAG